MNLLAIETTSAVCSAGLSIDGEIRVDHRVAAQQHGALILPMIDALLRDAGIAPQQLDGIAYGQGPGSFTGVRIGVAVTQGIALGAGLGVIGVSTLCCVAQGCYREHGQGQVAVSLDARMDEVYFAAFTVNDSGLMTAQSDERVCPPAAVPALPGLPADRAWCWAGSGAQRYANLIEDTVIDECQPHAMDVLALAQPLAIAGLFQSPENASPVYLRDKVAQTTAERESHEHRV